MIDKERFSKLKDEAETLKAQYDKASGAMEAITTSFKNDYGVSSLNEMVAKVDEMKQERDDKDAKANELMQTLEGLLHVGS